MKNDSRNSNSVRQLMRYLVGQACKLAVICICFTGFIFSSPPAMAQDKALAGLAEGLYAKMATTRGVIVLELYYDKTPLTVINFAGLAMGVKDANTPKGQPFYDGLTFHRVIKDFMIQGGDPEGTGTGGPGYAFKDEFHPALTHASAGILSMANSGPGTNGSQFFITHKATPWLDFKHTVFGKVVKGQDVVDLIAQGDKINHVTIVALGEKAKAFKYDQAAFDAVILKADEKKNAARKAHMDAFKEKMIQKYPDALAADQGLMYVQIKEGEGMPARKGRKVDIHFTGRLEDGKVFADSKAQGTPFSFVLGAGEVLKGWDIGVLGMKKGEVRRLLLPYTLAYGEKGYPGVIPPKADLIFDVELVNLN